MRKFVEGVDFDLVPDIKRAQEGDAAPWNIAFKGRVVNVSDVTFDDEKQEMLTSVDYISGEAFDEDDSQEFGELIIQIIMSSYEAKLNKGTEGE